MSDVEPYEDVETGGAAAAPVELDALIGDIFDFFPEKPEAIGFRINLSGGIGVGSGTSACGAGAGRGAGEISFVSLVNAPEPEAEHQGLIVDTTEHMPVVNESLSTPVALPGTGLTTPDAANLMQLDSTRRDRLGALTLTDRKLAAGVNLNMDLME